MNKEDLQKQIELLVKDDERSQQTIINQRQEIERLKSRLQQKENIIKEVREYIKDRTTHYTSYLGKEPKVVPKIELQREAYDKLLEILNKGE